MGETSGMGAPEGSAGPTGEGVGGLGGAPGVPDVGQGRDSAPATGATITM